MAHHCIDWTTRPPARKIPCLILTRGDDRVYIPVPNEFKTLEDIARKEFNLDDDASVIISSSCVNLCDGLPARITESAWEHINPYIGSATVEVASWRADKGQVPREQPENAADERENLPPDHDEPDHGLGGGPSTLAKETVWDEGDRERASTPENPEEEVSALFPQRSRHRRVAYRDDDDGSERDDIWSQASILASPSKTGKQVSVTHHLEPDSQPVEEPNIPVGQEKPNTGHSRILHRTDSQSEIRPQAPAESNDNLKLIIRVAHRPSKQESKFTTKATTRVGKVLAGACKSFGLDASRATMYLIVSTEEDGEVENLFPCDRNDSIARAGAERETESRFVLKMVGEA